MNAILVILGVAGTLTILYFIGVAIECLFDK